MIFYMKSNSILKKKGIWRTKMLEVFKKFFVDAEQLNKERFEEFMDFYKEILDNIPEKICAKLGDRNPPLLPSDKKDYYVDCNYNDLLWWESKWKTDNLIMRDVGQFKKEVVAKLLDIMRSYESFPEVKGQFKDIIDSIGKDK